MLMGCIYLYMWLCGADSSHPRVEPEYVSGCSDDDRKSGIPHLYSFTNRSIHGRRLKHLSYESNDHACPSMGHFRRTTETCCVVGYQEGMFVHYRNIKSKKREFYRVPVPLVEPLGIGCYVFVLLGLRFTCILVIQSSQARYHQR
ncbi:hypothetical protein RSAG8_13634, partial [Rhizoctonia solani AG-8 WAC10335]